MELDREDFKILTLPEAIISAFDALGGEREIKEIKDWIDERYGDRWKDIGTSMADMVPLSHGGSDSSLIHAKHRVLRKVSRGRYCLIKHESNKVEAIKVQKRKKYFTKIKSTVHNQLIQKENYLINIPNDHILEVYTTKRLSFEPKGWQLELRNAIKSHLKKLIGNGVILQAIYKSMDSAFFDVENVLFYNVGSSSFSHLNIKSLQFEREFVHPPAVNEHQHFEHFQSYKITEQDEPISKYWTKKKTLATWRNIRIPKLSSGIKPHSIWQAMKIGSVKILGQSYGQFYGLEVTIKAPINTQINLVAVIKPLLDGIISAFHHHDSSDLDEVVYRLNKVINLPQKQIEHYLLDSSNTLLGPRNLIQPYRTGVKWNPEDDAFHFLKINLEADHQNDYWEINGDVFTIDSLT